MPKKKKPKGSGGTNVNTRKMLEKLDKPQMGRATPTPKPKRKKKKK